MVTICTINPSDFYDYSPIPCAVRVRNKLNEAGIKFVDDNLLSQVINENPVPLGVLESKQCLETGNIRFRQTISEH